MGNIIQNFSVHFTDSTESWSSICDSWLQTKLINNLIDICHRVFSSPEQNDTDTISENKKVVRRLYLVVSDADNEHSPPIISKILVSRNSSPQRSKWSKELKRDIRRLWHKLAFQNWCPYLFSSEDVKSDITDDVFTLTNEIDLKFKDSNCLDGQLRKIIGLLGDNVIEDKTSKCGFTVVYPENPMDKTQLCQAPSTSSVGVQHGEGLESLDDYRVAYEFAKKHGYGHVELVDVSHETAFYRKWKNARKYTQCGDDFVYGSCRFNEDQNFSLKYKSKPQNQRWQKRMKCVRQFYPPGSDHTNVPFDFEFGKNVDSEKKKADDAFDINIPNFVAPNTRHHRTRRRRKYLERKRRPRNKTTDAANSCHEPTTSMHGEQVCGSQACEFVPFSLYKKQVIKMCHCIISNEENKKNKTTKEGEKVEGASEANEQTRDDRMSEKVQGHSHNEAVENNTNYSKALPKLKMFQRKEEESGDNDNDKVVTAVDVNDHEHDNDKAEHAKQRLEMYREYQHLNSLSHTLNEIRKNSQDSKLNEPSLLKMEKIELVYYDQPNTKTGDNRYDEEGGNEEDIGDDDDEKDEGEDEQFEEKKEVSPLHRIRRKPLTNCHSNLSNTRCTPKLVRQSNDSLQGFTSLVSRVKKMSNEGKGVVSCPNLANENKSFDLSPTTTFCQETIAGDSGLFTSEQSPEKSVISFPKGNASAQGDFINLHESKEEHTANENSAKHQELHTNSTQTDVHDKAHNDSAYNADQVPEQNNNQSLSRKPDESSSIELDTQPEEPVSNGAKNMSNFIETDTFEKACIPKKDNSLINVKDQYLIGSKDDEDTSTSVEVFKHVIQEKDVCLETDIIRQESKDGCLPLEDNSSHVDGQHGHIASNIIDLSVQEDRVSNCSNKQVLNTASNSEITLCKTNNLLSPKITFVENDLVEENDLNTNNIVQGEEGQWKRVSDPMSYNKLHDKNRCRSSTLLTVKAEDLEDIYGKENLVNKSEMNHNNNAHDSEMQNGSIQSQSSSDLEGYSQDPVYFSHFEINGPGAELKIENNGSELEKELRCLVNEQKTKIERSGCNVQTTTSSMSGECLSNLNSSKIIHRSDCRQALGQTTPGRSCVSFNSRPARPCLPSSPERPTLHNEPPQATKHSIRFCKAGVETRVCDDEKAGHSQTVSTPQQEVKQDIEFDERETKETCFANVHLNGLQRGMNYCPTTENYWVPAKTTFPTLNNNGTRQLSVKDTEMSPTTSYGLKCLSDVCFGGGEETMESDDAKDIIDYYRLIDSALANSQNNLSKRLERLNGSVNERIKSLEALVKDKFNKTHNIMWTLKNCVRSKDNKHLDGKYESASHVIHLNREATKNSAADTFPLKMLDDSKKTDGPSFHTVKKKQKEFPCIKFNEVTPENDGATCESKSCQVVASDVTSVDRGENVSDSGNNEHKVNFLEDNNPTVKFHLEEQQSLKNHEREQSSELTTNSQNLKNNNKRKPFKMRRSQNISDNSKSLKQHRKDKSQKSGTRCISVNWYRPKGHSRRCRLRRHISGEENCMVCVQNKANRMISKRKSVLRRLPKSSIKRRQQSRRGKRKTIKRKYSRAELNAKARKRRTNIPKKRNQERLLSKTKTIKKERFRNRSNCCLTSTGEMNAPKRKMSQGNDIAEYALTLNGHMAVSKQLIRKNNQLLKSLDHMKQIYSGDHSMLVDMKKQITDKFSSLVSMSSDERVYNLHRILCPDENQNTVHGHAGRNFGISRSTQTRDTVSMNDRGNDNTSDESYNDNRGLSVNSQRDICGDANASHAQCFLRHVDSLSLIRKLHSSSDRSRNALELSCNARLESDTDHDLMAPNSFRMCRGPLLIPSTNNDIMYPTISSENSMNSSSYSIHDKAFKSSCACSWGNAQETEKDKLNVFSHVGGKFKTQRLDDQANVFGNSTNGSNLQTEKLKGTDIRRYALYPGNTGLELSSTVCTFSSSLDNCSSRTELFESGSKPQIPNFSKFIQHLNRGECSENATHNIINQTERGECLEKVTHSFIDETDRGECSEKATHNFTDKTDRRECTGKVTQNLIDETDKGECSEKANKIFIDNKDRGECSENENHKFLDKMDKGECSENATYNFIDKTDSGDFSENTTHNYIDKTDRRECCEPATHKSIDTTEMSDISQHVIFAPREQTIERVNVSSSDKLNESPDPNAAMAYDNTTLDANTCPILVLRDTTTSATGGMKPGFPRIRNLTAFTYPTLEESGNQRNASGFQSNPCSSFTRGASVTENDATNKENVTENIKNCMDYNETLPFIDKDTKAGQDMREQPQHLSLLVENFASTNHAPNTPKTIELTPSRENSLLSLNNTVSPSNSNSVNNTTVKEGFGDDTESIYENHRNLLSTSEVEDSTGFSLETSSTTSETNNNNATRFFMRFFSLEDENIASIVNVLDNTLSSFNANSLPPTNRNPRCCNTIKFASNNQMGQSAGISTPLAPISHVGGSQQLLQSTIPGDDMTSNEHQAYLITFSNERKRAFVYKNKEEGPSQSGKIPRICSPSSETEFCSMRRSAKLQRRTRWQLMRDIKLARLRKERIQERKRDIMHKAPQALHSPSSDADSESSM